MKATATKKEMEYLVDLYQGKDRHDVAFGWVGAFRGDKCFGGWFFSWPENFWFGDNNFPAADELTDDQLEQMLDSMEEDEIDPPTDGSLDQATEAVRKELEEYQRKGRF